MLFNEYLLQEKNNLKPIVGYNFKLNNISYNSNIVQSKVLRYKTLFTAHPITCCCLSSCVDFHKSSQQCHHSPRDQFKQNDIYSKSRPTFWFVRNVLKYVVAKNSFDFLLQLCNQIT